MYVSVCVRVLVWTYLLPASLTFDPSRVPWGIFGLFDQSLQLLDVVEQCVCQLLKV